MVLQYQLESYCVPPRLRDDKVWEVDWETNAINTGYTNHDFQKKHTT